jgi:hypothetical protein
MDEIALKLCDIQGRLFELSAVKGYCSADFIKDFMHGATARSLDSAYNRMQWAGEEYLLDEIAEESNLKAVGHVLPRDVLYWIGYIYRYWHYYTGENSAQIYDLAPPETMQRNYCMFHTMDPVLAIESLKEISRQKEM